MIRERIKGGKHPKLLIVHMFWSSILLLIPYYIISSYYYTAGFHVQYLTREQKTFVRVWGHLRGQVG